MDFSNSVKAKDIIYLHFVAELVAVASTFAAAVAAVATSSVVAAVVVVASASYAFVEGSFGPSKMIWKKLI